MDLREKTSRKHFVSTLATVSIALTDYTMTTLLNIINAANFNASVNGSYMTATTSLPLIDDSTEQTTLSNDTAVKNKFHLSCDEVAW